jgi:hypothetical protein
MVHAPPVSFVLVGRQYIAVIAGRTLFTFGLPITRESISPDASVAKIKPADR